MRLKRASGRDDRALRDNVDPLPLGKCREVVDRLYVGENQLRRIAVEILKAASHRPR